MSDKLKTTPRPKRAKPGDFVRVPINDTQWSYGRVTGKTMAFYDVLTDHFLEPEQIRQYPIVFRAYIMRYAFNGKEWPVIGYLPLEEQLQKPAVFRSTLSSPEEGLYYATNENSEDYLVPYEQAKELELLSVYDAVHVVKRLTLHFEGKPYPHVEMFRLK